MWNPLVAREAEVDEPLAVEGARHILQNSDASLNVLNQIVITRQNVCDPTLKRKRRNIDWKIWKRYERNAVNCCARHHVVGDYLSPG